MTINTLSPANDLGEGLIEPRVVQLRDGSTAVIRKATGEDAPAIVEFLSTMSAVSRRLRFFTVYAPFAKLMEGLGRPGRIDLVAICGSPPRVVGHTMLSITGPGKAEVAFAVDEQHRQLGIASSMLRLLAEHAAEWGITTLEAVTLTENRRMLEVFRESGLHPEFHRNAGAIDVELHVTGQKGA